MADCVLPSAFCCVKVCHRTFLHVTTSLFLHIFWVKRLDLGVKTRWNVKFSFTSLYLAPLSSVYFSLLLLDLWRAWTTLMNEVTPRKARRGRLNTDGISPLNFALTLSLTPSSCCCFSALLLSLLFFLILFLPLFLSFSLSFFLSLPLSLRGVSLTLPWDEKQVAILQSESSLKTRHS